MTSIIWDRSDRDSSAIDMDTDEEKGFVWHEGSNWMAEADQCRINQHFPSMRAAEIAVEFALEQEDLLNG